MSSKCESMLCSEEIEETLSLNIAIGLEESLRNIEAKIIRIALGQTRGDISQAARLLGINRTTLHEKMRRYQI